MPMIEVTLEEAALLQDARRARRLYGDETLFTKSVHCALAMGVHDSIPQSYIHGGMAIQFSETLLGEINSGRMPVKIVEDAENSVVRYTISFYLIPVPQL